jgi:PAS domain S-box-containing protein
LTEPAALPGRRAIQVRSWAILAGLAFVVAASCTWLLYGRVLEARGEQLAEMARSQARFFEAVAKFDAFFQSGDVRGAARSATLSQIKEGHRKYTGFGDTGEMVLAHRVGREIVFLLPTRKRGFEVPPSLDWGAKRGGPMQLALEGSSGVVQALDHSGTPVLAAYEWLPFLEMGLVCKVDMAEIRQPFLRALMWTGLVALGAVLLGVWASSRMVSPLIGRVVDDARRIREREARYRGLVASIPGAVFRSDVDERRTFLELSAPIEGITGRPAEAFLDGGGTPYGSIVHPDDADIFRRAVDRYLEPGRTYKLEYRIHRADGEVRWVSEWGTVVKDADERTLLEGVMLDITDRKLAEETLEELPRKLSRYLSPQVYRSIFEGDQDVRVGSSRKKLTVFFSDIVDFTAKSDSLDPDDLSFLVNSYLNRMAELAVEHGGTLDKVIGDGVLIFFGDPESRGVAEDARACVRMARAMQESVESLNREVLEQGIEAPIQVRIGIATGYCTVGNFGSESRMDYTILGKTVNLAARLETAAGAGTINITRETRLLVQDEFDCTELDPIRVKGFDQPVGVFRVGEARS